MRIVGGSFRGRKLHSPKGDQIRPTTDKVREAIFNIIRSSVPGARVLDLFAGTGALGLEALSRGAVQAVFVDHGTEAVRLIQANIELCKARERARVLHGPVPHILHGLAREGQGFDLIFMDPPYGEDHIEKALSLLSGVARDGSLVVAEHHRKDTVPERHGEWVRIQQRRYGDTMISLFENGTPT